MGLISTKSTECFFFCAVLFRLTVCDRPISSFDESY